jgi:tRNA1Val (adenine37-N6)-methyltransferase
MEDERILMREDETMDELVQCRLKLLQKRRGYRFSLDAVLLAHFANVKKGDRILDLGAGSGIISLILARRFSSVEITGLEVQEAMTDMAVRNIRLNKLENRITVQQGDLRRIRTLFDFGSFDCVVFNPPYRKLKSGRVNPEVEKALARHEIKGAIGDFLSAAGYVLKETGRLYLIYPASRIVELFYRMRVHRLEAKRMRMVHSRMTSGADFTLVEGLRGGGEEMKVMPPLFIYEDGEEYSPEMKEIFRSLSDSR